MATKSAATGNKRKAGPVSKGKPDAKFKKPRVESKPQPKPQPVSTDESDDFDDLSDSDDGGVKLEKNDSEKGNKGDKGSKDKTFERGRSN